MAMARESIERIAGVLQSDPLVKAVWVAGSVARGDDDEVSDLDLWVESDSWVPDLRSGLLAAGMHATIGDSPLLHGVDAEGVIVDLRYGPVAPPEYRKLPSFSPVKVAPAPMDPAGFYTDFWINTYKDRKPLYRGLEPLVIFGLGFAKMSLVRAWVGDDTGVPEPDVSFSIFGLTDVVKKHLTPERVRLLGLPMRDRSEIVAAVVAYREEMLRLTPAGYRLPEIVMNDPLFRGLIGESSADAVGKAP